MSNMNTYNKVLESKPGTLLMAKAMRQELADKLTKEPVFPKAVMAVDGASKTYDALVQLYESRDPDLTREGFAKKFSERYQRAWDNVHRESKSALDSLSAHKGALIEAAERNVGLHDTVPYAEQAEYRAAFRAMSQDDRDKAIAQSIEEGDIRAIQALRGKGTALTGKITHNLETAIERIIQDNNPTLQQDLDQVDYAINCVGNAFLGFSKGAEKLRDPIGEERAETQKQKHAAALQALGEVANPVGQVA